MAADDPSAAVPLRLRASLHPAILAAIRIDSKRPALDTLDEQRKNGLREPNGADAPAIATLIEVGETLTSQLRHSWLCRQSGFRYAIDSTHTGLP